MAAKNNKWETIINNGEKRLNELICPVCGEAMQYNEIRQDLSEPAFLPDGVVGQRQRLVSRLAVECPKCHFVGSVLADSEVNNVKIEIYLNDKRICTM